MKKPRTFLKNKKKASDSNEAFFREINIEYLIHELKDPIAIIENNMVMLLEKKEEFGSLSVKQEKVLKRTLRSSQKTRDMLNGLLEIGRSQAGPIENSQFNPIGSVYTALIDSIEAMTGSVIDEPSENGGKEEIEELLTDNGILLDISPQVIDTKMNQDEIMFRQIVGNLIKNAIHHRKTRINITMSREEDLLSIDISDDGPGIDPKHHETIFQRYVQLKKRSTAARKGHGLGLAGSRILARRLGGEVEVVPKKREGATFRLTLPITLNSSISQ
ncbi:sensor histidine kinase [bacterium]|nr:sensor histidine kinase [bacterium]